MKIGAMWSLVAALTVMSGAVLGMQDVRTSSDMVVAVASSMEKIRPYGMSSAKTVSSGGVGVRLARNECESVQIVVSPCGKSLANVRVEASDLRLVGDEGGAIFAASNITCRLVGYVEVKQAPKYNVGYCMMTNVAPGYIRKTVRPEAGWWPDPILDFMASADIAEGTNQSFWVRVRCPDDQRAGIYRGAIFVCADGVSSVRVPFSVRVNDFAVGTTSPLPLAITFEPTAGAEIRADPLAPVNLWRHRGAEWCDFLADYYISLNNLYHHGRIYFDLLERLKSQGRLGLFSLGFWGPPASTNEADVARWRQRELGHLWRSYTAAKAKGLLDHAYIYGCDELKAKAFPAMQLAVAEMRKKFPGVSFSTTAFDDKFGVGSPLSAFDWFTPLTSKYNVEQAKASREQGHQVWWYICCSTHAPYATMYVESQAIEGRMLMGAQTVRMRPDGFLYYEISEWRTPRCIESGPFTDWDPVSYRDNNGWYHGDGSWTYAGPDGMPLPSIRLENFRDGLEDYAYAMILERRLKEVERGACRTANWMAWCEKAKQLLSVPRNVVDSMTNYTDDPAVLYLWRDAMADLIEESNGIGGSGDSALRVGTYNIRCQPPDKGTPNAWDARKADLAELVRRLDFDVVGLQEVCPEQADFLTNSLPQYAMVGVHREDGKREGEASPVFYRKARFDAIKSGTFWLSETPDVPGSKSWGTAYARVCSWAWLRDKKTGKTLCFANTHTDHASALARKEGMLLIVRKMREFAPSGTPVVFTGDHNCCEVEEPAEAVSKLLKNALSVAENPPKGPWRTFNGWKSRDAEYAAVDALKLPPQTRNARLEGDGIPYADRYACGGPRIDFIYVSEGVHVKSYETRDDVRPGTKLYPSDHFPLLAEIELPFGGELSSLE